jgi:hypothetical protein
MLVIDAQTFSWNKKGEFPITTPYGTKGSHISQNEKRETGAEIWQ